jgi:VWFA-related protein
MAAGPHGPVIMAGRGIPLMAPTMTTTTITRLILPHALIAVLAFSPPLALAQAQGPQRPPASSQVPPPQSPQQQPPPATPQQGSQQPQDQQQSGQPGFAIAVTVPVVNVDVVVTDNDGNYLNGLKKENFRILEDGAPQTITNFGTTDAPITVVLLLEFSQIGYGWFLYNAVSWADVFLHQLKPNDWIALESFNMRSNVEVDFTHNPREVEQGLISLYFPPFHESNLFDALADVTERLQDVKGKKAVLVLASGIDTFSRLTLDKTIAKLKQTDVTVYCVGVAEQMFVRTLDNGGLTYLQAQNQLKSFAEMTGGRAWFPRFDGEIPNIMADVAGSLRNEYSLGYIPSNAKNDGKYRKIKVEVVAPDGGPLTVLDQKGKKRKFQVYARQGYTAPTSSVSN